jgi:prepilin signal peptidase PulO-like enzyme (type II secretory pathway)
VIAAFIILGAAAGLLGAYTFRRLPARWLCDFGEDLCEKHLNPELSKKEAAMIICVMAVLFPLSYLQSQNTLRTYSVCLSLFFVLLCCLADMRYQIIPTQLCALIAALSPLSVRTLNLAAWIDAFGGGIILGSVFLLFGLMGKAVYKMDTLGFGDVYFAASLGLYLSVSTSWMVFWLAVLFAGVYFGLLKIFGRQKGELAALGPFIGMAFETVVAAESWLKSFAAWYWHLIIGS